MNCWIRAYDHSKFRVADFIHDYGFIDWSMKNHYEPGDIVFLYATAPQSRLRFMMEVEKVNLRADESADDSAYFISQEHYLQWLRHRDGARYVRFLFLKDLSSTALTYENLMQHGLGGAPRSPRRLFPQTVDYIMSHLDQGADPCDPAVSGL